MALFMKEQFLKDISVHRSAIMGISIIAIILFHQDFVSTFPLNMFNYFGYWGVDVFLLLSGMGLVNTIESLKYLLLFARRNRITLIDYFDYDSILYLWQRLLLPPASDLLYSHIHSLTAC